jgi:hypothetical protein
MSTLAVLGPIGFVLSLINLVIAKLPEHRRRQQFRRDEDGATLPWWMCWVYWFGLEHRWVGKR